MPEEELKKEAAPSGSGLRLRLRIYWMFGVLRRSRPSPDRPYGSRSCKDDEYAHPPFGHCRYRPCERAGTEADCASPPRSLRLGLADLFGQVYGERTRRAALFRNGGELPQEDPLEAVAILRKRERGNASLEDFVRGNELVGEADAEGVNPDNPGALFYIYGRRGSDLADSGIAVDTCYRLVRIDPGPSEYTGYVNGGRIRPAAKPFPVIGARRILAPYARDAGALRRRLAGCDADSGERVRDRVEEGVASGRAGGANEQFERPRGPGWKLEEAFRERCYLVAVSACGPVD